MVEYWNIGTMGSGKMGQWLIARIPPDMEGVNLI
jgi:predicted homoserine dehydrogenase-like protein